MESKSLLSIAVGMILLVPISFALATSGACSHHGGVNCAAGAQPDGMVICNDGWLGSSVSYDSMEECQQTPSFDYTPTDTYCPQPIIVSGQCILQSEVQQWQSLCSQEESTQRTACIREGMFGTSACVSGGTPEACQQETDCQNEVNAYNQEEKAYQSCISGEISDITNAETQSANARCLQQEGQYSTFDQKSNSCVCQPGYWLDSTNGQCEKPATACTNELGANSYPMLNSGGQCACDSSITSGGANYTVGSDGQCDLVQEPVHTISQSAYNVATSGGSCRTLSGQDETDCDLYGSHPYDYDWRVIQPPTSNTNPAPTTSTSAINALSLPLPSKTLTPPATRSHPQETTGEATPSAPIPTATPVPHYSNATTATTTTKSPSAVYKSTFLNAVGGFFRWLNPRLWL